MWDYSRCGDKLQIIPVSLHWSTLAMQNVVGARRRACGPPHDASTAAQRDLMRVFKQRHAYRSVEADDRGRPVPDVAARSPAEDDPGEAGAVASATASGSYTVAVFKLVRLAAIVTLLVLGLYLWRQFVRERRRIKNLTPASGVASAPRV